MSTYWNHKIVLFLASLVLFPLVTNAQTVPAAIQAKLNAKVQQLRAWSTDPQIVSAVKAYNANPPAEATAMTNEKWKSMSLLDPAVRSFSKNPLGTYLKSKKDSLITEAFISGAGGGKVAFLSKPSGWSHQGKDKHMVPMTGKVWLGPVEVDDSSGQQQVQVGLPVLDGGKPIGSIVVGLSVAGLK